MGAITVIGEGQVTVSFWAQLLGWLGLGAIGRVAKSERLIRKARERQTLDSEAALAIFDKAIELLSATEGLDQERRALLGPALLERGRLQETAGSASQALESYLQARGFLSALPRPVLTFVAAALARRGDKQASAIAIYLEYISSLRAEPKAKKASHIYNLLKKCCAVNEATPPREAQERLSLCERVIEADKSIEWAHYYAGIAHFSNGRFSQALPRFTRARAIQPSLQLLDFYHAYSQGMTDAQAGKLEQAIASFRQASHLQPKRPDAQFALGLTLVDLCHSKSVDQSQRARWIDEAVASLELAAQLDSRAANYAFYLGRAYTLSGQHAPAAEAFERATQLDKTKPAYFLNLGLALQALNSRDEARAAALSALALDKQYIPAHQLLGELYLEAKEYKAAVGEYQIVLAASPQDLKARKQLGVAFYYQRRYDDAIKMLEHIYMQSNTAMFYLARCYAKTDQREKATELLEDLTRRQPANTRAHYYLALSYAWRGHYPEAVKAFGHAIKANDTKASYYFQRGHASFKLGALDDARADYGRALELEPESTDILLGLGTLCRIQGDDATAISYLRQAVQLAPRNIVARLALGSAYEKSDNFSAALVEYSIGAEFDPDNPVTHRRLGILHCRQDDYEAAVEKLRLAASLGDDSDELLHYLGLATAHLKDYEAAMSAWNKLSARHTHDQRLALNLNRLHYLAGKAHVEGGRLPEAIAEWQSYLELRRDDEELKKEIAQLYFRVALCEFSGEGESSVASAESALEQAIALDAAHPVYRYYASLCRLAQGHWDVYLSSVRELLPQLDSKMQLHARYHEGIAWLAQNKPDKAAPLLSEILSQAGRLGLKLDASLPMAIIHARAGRWEESINLLNSESAQVV